MGVALWRAGTQSGTHVPDERPSIWAPPIGTVLLATYTLTTGRKALGYVVFTGEGFEAYSGPVTRSAEQVANMLGVMVDAN